MTCGILRIFGRCLVCQSPSVKQLWRHGSSFVRPGIGMSRLVPSRLIRLVAFAATVVIGGMAVDRAEASCGGYVHVRGKNLHVEHGAMANVPVGANSDVDGKAMFPSRPAGEPQRTPCHGPTCSNGSMPPAAPVPSEPVSTDQWACTLSHGVALPDATSSLLPLSDVEPSDGCGLSIIRPPR